jgi:hypothetical protein
MGLHIFHFGRQGMMDNLGPLSTHISYIGDRDLQYVEEDKYTWLYDSLPRIGHLYRTVHNGKGRRILSVFFQGKPESRGIHHLFCIQVLHKWFEDCQHIPPSTHKQVGGCLQCILH